MPEVLPEVLQELPNWLITAALAALLAALVYAITKGYTIELWPPRFTAPESRRWVGSPGTHDDELLTSMINDALETVCRAVCVPSSPRETSVRAFIFQRRGTELVCTHFWAEYPSEEQVDVTRFYIDRKSAETAVIVRAYLEASIQRSPVKPNPSGLKGEINKNLEYVLACPVYTRSAAGEKQLIGVVDFDASRDEGVRLLESEIANEVMYCLARATGVVLSIGSSNPVDHEG